jgi:hypothetical protein
MELSILRRHSFFAGLGWKDSLAVPVFAASSMAAERVSNAAGHCKVLGLAFQPKR